MAGLGRSPLTMPAVALEPESPIAPVAKTFSGLGLDVSRLSNGVTVATVPMDGPQATVGIFVEGGSQFEDMTSAGSSHALEHMAFKSTPNRSSFRTSREIEGMGAQLSAQASREHMAYIGDSIKAHAPGVFEILADTVVSPVLYGFPWPHEISDQRDKIKADIAALDGNAQALSIENLHTAAYSGGLSRPLVMPHRNVDELSHVILSNATASVRGGAVTVVAAGVNHMQLVEQAERTLGRLPSGRGLAPPASVYEGGEHRTLGKAGSETTVCIGFEHIGGWSADNIVVSAVVQTLMGGGGSFSAGGPGKGMYSRLYSRVLNQHHWVQNCTAMLNCYSASSLFSLSGTCASEQAGELAAIMVQEMRELASNVTDEEVQRAKNATKANVLMACENRAIVVEDIGRQIPLFGKPKSAEALVHEVEMVTPASIKKFALGLMKGSISLSIVGDGDRVPGVAQLQKLV